mmetsp:Transcript_58987/g.97519  ORF Transcript_58987/g.97519 Transcript_58987/m.97519 type:complete len:257 (+) Transcript_58987:62-832(+)
MLLAVFCLPAVGLLAGPARPASKLVTRAGSRACVRAVVAEPPTGFYWGFDSRTPDAELLEPPISVLERLSFSSFDTSTPTISQEEVLTAQTNWASAIKTISAVYAEGGDFIGTAAEAAGELYGYGKTNVLFKPTKATNHPFRPTAEQAMSYFVGAEAMKNDKFKGEDAGFAINGGKGWKSVVFRNHKVDLNGPTAQAMGDYVFTDATSGDEVRVEYTFGYKRNDDSNVRIYLHHSSVPYTPASPTPITLEEAKAAL